MEFDKIKNVYFLGIGGIGMSALARYFHSQGKHVAGYDKTPTTLTDELIQEGIEIHFEDSIEIAQQKTKNTKHETLIVYTPAIPKDNSELNYCLSNGFTVKKRSEVLGLICENHFTIAVAGTHGKTTTSSMIAHILALSGVNFMAFLGGVSRDFASNFLFPGRKMINDKWGLGKGTKYSQSLINNSNFPIIIVEADEYDRSFLALHPDIAIITSMDADHLDIYGDKKFMEESYRLFASQVKANGTLIYKKGLDVGNIKAQQKQYSLTNHCDYSASEIRIENHQYVFTWNDGINSIRGLSSQMPGRHNVENAVAAVAVARLLGIDDDKIAEGLRYYHGVKRRFDYWIKKENLVFIDDYAHHPEELRACIESVRELYPKKKITGIFQPHLFTRTRDFADGFAKSLSLLDELILLPIYPAREQPIEGVTSKIIFDRASVVNKVMCRKEDLLRELATRKIEVLLTLGAGDIDQLVEPIRKLLMPTNNESITN